MSATDWFSVLSLFYLIVILKSLHYISVFVVNVAGDVFQVSYAIGVAHPLSISIFHYGTSKKSEQELLEIVKKNFDLRPGVIVR